MAEKRVSGNPEHVLETARLAACVVGILGITAFSIAGHWGWGLFGAVGLAVGFANMSLAERLVSVGVPFLITSMSRIFFISLLAVGGVILFPPVVAISFLLGAAAFQLVVAGSAFLELSRR